MGCPIAGWVLHNHVHGGAIDQDFVDMLSEDHREVLRQEGTSGITSVEDHIIGRPLELYRGSHRDGVLRLFTLFAVFAEDAVVPASAIDVVVPLMEAAGGSSTRQRQPPGE